MRSHVSKAVALLVVGFTFIGSMVLNSKTVFSEPTPMAQSDRALLSPKVNVLALLTDIYHRGGYSMQDATHIAHVKLGRPHKQTEDEAEIETELEPGQALLHPEANTLALVYDAFLESGWASEQAMEHARSALNIEVAEAQCVVYEVRYVYCSGGQKVTDVRFMNALCYEGPNGNDGLNQCDLRFNCLPPNKYKFYNLTVKSVLPSDCAIQAPAGSCIWLRIASTPTSVDCEELDINCSCFVETSPTIDCDAIEYCCFADGQNGGNGCPLCTGCP